MTFAERAAALEALGFRPRPAAFLTTVALHSGYCVRRQYAAFAGINYGKNVGDFLEHLVERKLADRIVFRTDRGAIYHLVGRSLYAAIGQADNRNRRHASPPVIARKLMLLDFVLAHPDFAWYATEADKTDLFVTRLGVPEAVPPPLPVFLHGDSPTVHFVTVVTDAHASPVEAFVRDHAPLLRHVPAWTLNAVIPRNAATDAACETAYTQALKAASLASISKGELDWFARTRPLVLSNDLRSLSVEDLRRYRQLAAAIGGRLDAQGAGPLIVHRLPHSYAQFGSFAGLA
jgi:hypothetical protein